MITEGLATIPLEMTLHVFRNQEKTKQRSTIEGRLKRLVISSVSKISSKPDVSQTRWSLPMSLDAKNKLWMKVPLWIKWTIVNVIHDHGPIRSYIKTNSETFLSLDSMKFFVENGKKVLIIKYFIVA